MRQQRNQYGLFNGKISQFDQQDEDRQRSALGLACSLGIVAVLSTGVAVGGECPNTVSGRYDVDHAAVYSDCGTNRVSAGRHNVMLYDGTIIITPELPSKLNPAPGADANPINYVEKGLYVFDTDGQCPGVSGALNDVWSLPQQAFKYYCAVWRDSSGREQRTSAQWRGTSFNSFANYTMTDTAIITTYPITEIANPSVGGSVTCTPNPVAHGGSSTCVAAASTGYSFETFSGDCSGETCVLDNVTAPMSVTGNFHCVDASIPAGVINYGVTYECDRLSAPFNVEIVSPGNVEFRVTDEISIGSGFRVTPGAIYRGVVVP